LEAERAGRVAVAAWRARAGARMAALGGPLGLAALGVAGTAYVAVVDPGRPGHYPGCPFLALTGWWCPACGGLRCVHALTRGDLAAAAHDNLLVLAGLVLAVPLWLRWTARVWLARDAVGQARERHAPPDGPGRRRPSPAALRTAAWLAAALVVAFTVLRNLPVGAALAPPR